MQTAGVDRLDALYTAIDLVRRGGTISLVGVYGGMADPMPMLQLFDKQVQLRMGQAQRAPLGRPTSCRCSRTRDPLGVDDFATHHLPLDGGTGGVRDVPEEAGRHGQGPAAAAQG